MGGRVGRWEPLVSKLWEKTAFVFFEFRWLCKDPVCGVHRGRYLDSLREA